MVVIKCWLFNKKLYYQQMKVADNEIMKEGFEYI